MYESTLKLFYESGFTEWESSRLRELADRIKHEDEDYIINVNEEQYLEHLVSEFWLEPLVLHFDSVEATDEEKLVPAERFPPMSFVSRGQSYLKHVFTFHVPVSGPIGLLRMAPSNRLAWTIQVELDRAGSTISFDIIRFEESMERVNAQYDATVQKITQQLDRLRAEVDAYNAALRPTAKSLFDQRRSELRKKADLRSALKVPIRKNAAPATFAVPVKSPKRIVPRPHAPSGAYVIDPTIDSATYQEILRLIHDFGKQLERLPQTYKGKDEETLRDHFLLLLQPHFGLEGSATGETFNASGKTDILIRYQNQNIFVAEFKFWRGPKHHHETIDQLLSYLTWRDSKTAIVYFIDGKEMIAPLKAIEETTPLHASLSRSSEKRRSHGSVTTSISETKTRPFAWLFFASTYRSKPGVGCPISHVLCEKWGHGRPFENSCFPDIYA